MTQPDIDKALSLLRESKNLPYGDVRLRLTEEAVRIADSTADEELMFYLRLEQIDSATFSGRRERALTAFSWCLSKFRAEPEEYEQYRRSLLWRFKYVMVEVIELPQISRSEFDDLANQMTQEYQAAGYNLRPVHYLKMQFATPLGDRDWARREYDTFQATPRDTMADCEACEADSVIEYHELFDEHQQMIDLAQPSLQGKCTCAEAPHRTYAYVLRPLAKLNRLQEADECQRQGYRLIRDNPSFLRHVGLHMAYLAHRENWAPAVGMFEKHLAWALSTFQLRSQYVFYAAALHVLKQIEPQHPTQKLRLPKEFPNYNAEDEYQTSEVIQWLQTEVDKVGERFDSRNGSSFHTTEYTERLVY